MPLRTTLTKWLLQIIALLLAVQGWTHVEDSRDWLVRERQHRALDSLQTEFGFANTPMPKDNAVAIIRFEGVSCQILAVGPVSSDAKAYAIALDKWRAENNLPGEVLYSQENDCAAASYSMSNAQFGSKSGQISIPLRSLMRTLNLLERKVNVALSSRYKTDFSINTKPNYLSPSGTEIWDFTNAQNVPEVVTARVVVPTWQFVIIGILIVWLPLVASVIAFKIWRAMNDSRRTIDEKRQYYSTWIKLALIIGMSVHFPIFVVALTNSSMNLLSFMWTGDRFGTFGLIVIMVPVLVGMWIILWIAGKERKLFQATPEEQAMQNSILAEAAKPESLEMDKRADRIRTAIAFSGIFILMSRTWFGKRSGWEEIAFALGIVLILTYTILVFAASKRKFAKAGSSQANLDEKLRCLAEPILQKMAPGKTIRVNVLNEQVGLLAMAKSNQVCMAPKIVELFDDAEIQFLVAHESAHVVLGHTSRSKRISLLAMIAILTGLALTIIATTFHSGWSVLVLVITFALPILSMVPQIKGQHLREFSADELAVRTTGDKAAAESALRKISVNAFLPGLHKVDTQTHPAMQKRIDAIRNLSL